MVELTMKDKTNSFHLLNFRFTSHSLLLKTCYLVDVYNDNKIWEMILKINYAMLIRTYQRQS